MSEKDVYFYVLVRFIILTFQEPSMFYTVSSRAPGGKPGSPLSLSSHGRNTSKREFLYGQNIFHLPHPLHSLSHEMFYMHFHIISLLSRLPAFQQRSHSSGLMRSINGPCCSKKKKKRKKCNYPLHLLNCC